MVSIWLMFVHWSCVYVVSCPIPLSQEFWLRISLELLVLHAFFTAGRTTQTRSIGQIMSMDGLGTSTKPSLNFSNLSSRQSCLIVFIVSMLDSNLSLHFLWYRYMDWVIALNTNTLVLLSPHYRFWRMDSGPLVYDHQTLRRVSENTNRTYFSTPILISRKFWFKPVNADIGSFTPNYKGTWRPHTPPFPPLFISFTSTTFFHSFISLLRWSQTALWKNKRKQGWQIQVRRRQSASSDWDYAGYTTYVNVSQIFPTQLYHIYYHIVTTDASDSSNQISLVATQSKDESDSIFISNESQKCYQRKCSFSYDHAYDALFFHHKQGDGC